MINTKNIQKPTSLFSRQNIPTEYKKIAAGMEKQFITHLLSEMERSTNSSELKGPGGEFYKSLLRDERAQIMSNIENSIGLKDIILEQIVPDHLKNQIPQKANPYEAVKMFKNIENSKREL